MSAGFPANLAPRVLSIVRVVSAYLFVLHGSAKHLKIPFIEAMASVSPTSLSGIAGWLELVGGFLLLLGLFTRPVAFVLSGLMAFAYFIAHAPATPFFPLMNGGESAVLFCFIFLYFSVAGGGSWSIDALRSRR
nr:DoxX family protein [Castellaniella sp.]